MVFRNFLLRLSLGHFRQVAGFWFALLLGMFVVLAFRLAGPEEVIDNSVGIWFLKDDPDLELHAENNEAFGSKEWSLLLLETRSVADPVFLEELARLTSGLESVPHVRRVVSLANVPRPAGELRAALEKMPTLEKLLLPQGWGTRTAILVQSDNLLHNREPYRIALVDSIHRLVDGVPTVINHALAGTTVINAELNRAAKTDALRFYTLVTAMILGFGWLALRDFRDLFILAVVLMVAVLGPMGAIASLGMPFNIVTILLPLVLVSLSVCDVIHVIIAFHGERVTRPAADAARAAIERLWTPCFWTSVVTIAGVLSLATSTVAPIRQMGLFASMGLVLAWACTMTLVPALLSAFWANRTRSTASGWAPGTHGERLLPYLSGRWRWLWLPVAALLVVPMAGIMKLEVDTDYTRFFAPGAPVSRAYQELEDAGMAQSVLEVVVAADNSKWLDGADGRAGMRVLESRVRDMPFVRNTLSEAALLEPFAGGNDDSSALGKMLPSSMKTGMIRTTARAAGFSGLDDYATRDRSRQRIVVLTDHMSARELGAFKASVEATAAEILPPAVSASVLGTAVLWANMDREIENTQVRSIWVMAAVFFMLLPILFRSVWLGLLGVFINGLPLAMTFGLMGLLGLRLNMATALIGGVSIGSTVDSTLFFINRFQAERASGKAWAEAIAAAVRGVGDGIIMTTGILAGGFLCMTVSSFLPTAHFGIFTCFTIVTGAFLDIFISPIVLGFFAPSASRNGRAA